MIDLGLRSGLPINLDLNSMKIVSTGIKLPRVKVKTIKKIKEVLFNQDVKDLNPYKMYKGINLTKDSKIFKKHNVRYDITFVPAGKFGKEYAKTYGHSHLSEIYEVIKGEALFLIQNINDRDIRLYDVREGEKLVIPGNYEHNVINPSDEPLVISNLISAQSKINYNFIKNNQGMSYYGFIYKNKIKFIQNPNYKLLPKLRRLRPKLGTKISKKKPLYQQFISNPEKFSFLQKA